MTVTGLFWANDLRGLSPEHREEFWTAAQRALEELETRFGPKFLEMENVFSANYLNRLLQTHRRVERGEPPSSPGNSGAVVPFDGEMIDLTDLWDDTAETKMGSPNVHSFTDQNFDAEVLNSPIPVLVHFTATWCGPCRALSPIVEKIAEDFSGRIKVGKLDIDDAPETTKKYGIRSVPNCVVFQGGQKTGAQAGLTNRETLLALLAPNAPAASRTVTRRFRLERRFS